MRGKGLARKAAWGLAWAAMALAAGPWPALAQQADVTQLSIEQLADVEITTVSKTPQPLSDVAAPAYVISHDDITHSGATSLPEILRLAPNLEVMQTSASAYDITARGLNGNSSAQNFSNKLLVLIDGRSVYSPLFSGVYWDMQDVLPEDIERIEVVSGPGGTLWGANAVNGVINIVTRKSSDTQGGFVDLGAGNLASSAALQYGGKLDDDLSYRIYAKTFYDQALDQPGGASGHDGWGKPQGGFRLDWSPGEDFVTLQGDIYSGAEAQAGTTNQDISGGNVMARWSHALDDGQNLDVLAYYDQATRESVGNGGFTLNTYDVEVQHNFALGSWNNIVWGAGERIMQYRITPRVDPSTSLLWSPAARTLSLGDVFAEDHISLGSRVDVTLGLKLESDPFSGLSAMPSGRIAWKLGNNDLIWAAASHAVRSPTPFDTDVMEKLGTVTFLTGTQNFLPEQVTAYELGYRGTWSPDLTFSLTLFEDVYDDLRSIEPTPVSFTPLFWGNKIGGDIHGLEAWASWQATGWWRLSAGLNLQHEDLNFTAGASQLLGLSQQGDDPHTQAQLRSTIALSDAVSVDTDFRYVGPLPDPHVPDYVEMNGRLGWKVSPMLELSLSGFNLLHAHHLEYVTGSQDVIGRSVFAETRWRF